GGGECRAGGLEPPGGSFRTEAPDGSLGANHDAAPAAGLEQTLVVECGMQFARPLHDHAAEIIVAGDFFALPFAGHHVGAGLRCPIEHAEPPRLPVLMPSRPAPPKPP